MVVEVPRGPLDPSKILPIEQVNWHLARSEL